MTLILAVLVAAAAPVAADPQLNETFSFPRDVPNTLLGPGQFFELAVPRQRRVVITDVYVQNHPSGLPGRPTGNALVHICEMRLPTGCEIRYSFHTTPGQVLTINYSTGLRAGEVTPVSAIRILNEGPMPVHPRVNGYFAR